MFLPVDQNIFFLSIANLKYFRTHNYIIIIQLFICLLSISKLLLTGSYIGDCMNNII